MAVLLVNGDREVSWALSCRFRACGCRIDVVCDGESALSVARHGAYDVLIAAWHLPGISAAEVVRTLRKESISVPVIFLTPAAEAADMDDAGMPDGCETFTDPLEFSTLVERAWALGGPLAASATRLTAGTIELDLPQKIAVRNGRLLYLSAHEFRLLEFLVRNVDKAVSRKRLLKEVWHLDFDPLTSVVESHVSRLRKRLRAPSEFDPIETIRGVGYKLISTP